MPLPFPLNSGNYASTAQRPVDRFLELSCDPLMNIQII